MNREEAHQLIDKIFDFKESPEVQLIKEGLEEIAHKKLPKDKRVVRTKSSGDRVYFLDEEKKTRQWVTNPDVLKGLGFEIDDVTEVEDSELLGYQMAAALYQVSNADS